MRMSIVITAINKWNLISPPIAHHRLSVGIAF